MANSFILLGSVVAIGIALISISNGFTIRQEATVSLEDNGRSKSKLNLPIIPEFPKFGHSSRPGKNPSNSYSYQNSNPNNNNNNVNVNNNVPTNQQNQQVQQTHFIPLQNILSTINAATAAPDASILVPLSEGVAELHLPEEVIDDAHDQSSDKDNSIQPAPAVISQSFGAKNETSPGKPEKLQQNDDLSIPIQVLTIMNALGSGGSIAQASKPEKDGMGSTSANAIGYATGKNATVNASVTNQIEVTPSAVIITDSAASSASSSENGTAYSQATLTSNGYVSQFNNGWGRK